MRANTVQVRGGAFEEEISPFSRRMGEGINYGCDAKDWVVNEERQKSDEIFATLSPHEGKITGKLSLLVLYCMSIHRICEGSSAKTHLVKSKLPNAILGKIWRLADFDRDGKLDIDEFALANYLVKLKIEGARVPVCVLASEKQSCAGHELPTELPQHLVPPSKMSNDCSLLLTE